jgi:hypothetical protein
MSSKKQAKKKPKGDAKTILKGPEPERLKIEGDWIGAIDKALKVKRPAKGWPK